jgi:sugar transferase (PEP-CTERM/EpsH1 system associated)
MGEILFIAHRIPFPPDRGDKIRSHHVLRRLAQLAPVHVACFADDELDRAAEPELAALARSYRLVSRSKPLALAGMQALAARSSISVAAFRDREIAAYVAQVLATRPISAIHVFSGQMGQYVPESFSGRLILDFCDVDSAKFEAYADKAGAPMRWVHAREARLLRAEEARLATRADVSLFATREEAALFVERLPASQRGAADVRVLANGIDSAAFDPAIVTPEPRMLACSGPRLIFTGQMDYAPNIDAAIRAIDRILPLVRNSLPDATFHVVGRNPAKPLLGRNGRGGCHVWGRVEDIRPWLRAADLALVPLEIGRGVQNKVLEAMAMGLPCVLSREAATGIEASDGRHFEIGASDRELADRAVALLRNRNRASEMGEAARRFVIENASWSAALAALPDLTGFAQGGRVRDAA